MGRILAVGLAALAAVLVAAAAVPAAPAGPQTKKCGKLKAKAAKRSCLKQNKANRIAFGLIKDSNFKGLRGDGEEVDHTFCGNGRYETRTTGSDGTGTNEGRRWRVDDATVRRNGRWIDAIVYGQGGLQIGVARRGTQWQIGIASFGEVDQPGDVIRSNARQACAAL